MSNAVEVRGLDVLFEARGRRAQRTALAALDRGESRDALREASGVVAGVVDASLDVAEGSIVVLMGLSGSGKSSLLRAVNGLNPSARGSIGIKTAQGMVDVCGLSTRGLRRLRRHSLAMVFQQFGLLPWATVAENVAFGLSVRGESRARRDAMVKHQLELVGLDNWAEAPIASLSGGMQQRVGLARAFATEADILLMDEPFSALDPLIREHLQSELLALQARLGRTILFVSHDLDEALRLGSRIVIMDGGRIVQDGTPEDIVFRPANDYVANFARHVNPLSVLTARTVMQPLLSTAVDANGFAAEIDIDCPVGELLALTAKSDTPLLVLDQGAPAGRVDRKAVLDALAERMGSR